MSEATTFNILITGNVLGDRESAILALAELFKKTEHQVESLLIKAPIAIKKKVDRTTAEKYRKAIEQRGFEVSLEENKPALHNQWTLEPTEDEIPRRSNTGKALFEAKDVVPENSLVATQEGRAEPSISSEEQDNLYATPQSEILEDDDFHEVDMTLKDIYFSFEGRINRRTYWLKYVLATIGLGALIGLITALLPTLGLVLILLAIVPFIWATIAVSVKRLHDINLSGWWYLITVIPTLLEIIVGIVSGEESTVYLIIVSISALCGLALFIMNGFIPGTKGGNTYGYPQSTQ